MTTIFSGGVTHTDRVQDKGLASWTVDLGDWYKIRKVKLWNRVECANRINNASVFVGKNLVGTVVYEEGKRFYEFNVGNYCNKTVTVGLATGEPLSLAQVEVLGTGEKGILECFRLYFVMRL